MGREEPAGVSIYGDLANSEELDPYSPRAPADEQNLERDKREAAPPKERKRNMFSNIFSRDKNKSKKTKKRKASEVEDSEFSSRALSPRTHELDPEMLRKPELAEALSAPPIVLKAANADLPVAQGGATYADGGSYRDPVRMKKAPGGASEGDAIRGEVLPMEAGESEWANPYRSRVYYGSDEMDRFLDSEREKCQYQSKIQDVMGLEDAFDQYGCEEESDVEDARVVEDLR